ncbi:MAG: cytochrome C3 subunit A [Deltaproteobacteria bacterium]|nr:cytochrome c3 family protein [Deltaproteobacteria bacterium]MBW2077444.1 cytochrome c3 family protein [Deltaproteobacteria bacterium]MBW2312048.1 cytochrome c3 family protein [Deltaproteobacteria bacterium]RLB31820.1 MAG: cytochrome C3 subunit A [Deltaproteobacteria bacterium]
MRKRILFLAGVIVSAALFAGIGITLATDAPDEISILDPAIEKHRKGAVKFNHKKHAVDYKVACTECHHVYKEGKNVYKEGDPVQKCSACHDAVKSKGKVKKLILAYHKNCQGCHKKLEKAGKKTGPTKKCNDCHEKK